MGYGMYDVILPRVPLILVFLSGLGFSIQSLVVRTLSLQGFRASSQCIFSRGLQQFVISALFVYFDSDRQIPEKNVKLFGNNYKITIIMFLRSSIGFTGIAFGFLAVEKLPIGDAVVLIMMSPFFSAILGVFVLGESIRYIEIFAGITSLVGVILVARPVFVFGESDSFGPKVNMLGVIYALLGAFFAGIAHVLVRVLGTVAKMPWSNVAFTAGLGQVVFAYPTLYLTHEKLRFDLSLFQYILIFMAGFIGSWSQIAMTIGMQREKSAAATGMRMSDILFGFIWQAVFTSDKIQLLTIIGALLVSSSIILIIIFKQAETHPVNTSESPKISVELSQTTYSKILNSDKDEGYDEEVSRNQSFTIIEEDDDDDEFEFVPMEKESSS
eukprot:gene5171-7198_t